MKLCRSCNQSKPFSEFNKDRRSGHQNKCRACERLYKLARYAKKKHELIPKVMAWHKAHPASTKAAQSKYRKSQKYKDRYARFRQTEKFKLKNRLDRQRRRARLRKCVIEKINPIAIAERDNWRCHICKKKVTLKDFSLDHLVPISQGGPHTASNVATAHFVCNNRRGAGRIPAQLLLEIKLPLS